MTIWVMVADSARARIFSTPSSREPLAEVQDLVHPESRSQEQGLVSDAYGAGRSAGSPGHTFGVADNAKKHEVERFAAEVARVLCKANEQRCFDRLHLLAAPAFLGQLRSHLDDHTRQRVGSEHAVSVIHESAAEIRARLPARI